MKLNNTLLATDLDGTLLTDDKRIMQKDLDAIGRLHDNGGLFTIATGRGLSKTVRRIAGELSLRIPAVIYNGAAVYDFSQDCFLWKRALPEAVTDYVELFQSRFPSIGVEVQGMADIYVTHMTPLIEEHVTIARVNPARCSLEDVRADTLIKILLADEPQVIDEVERFAASLDIRDIHLVRSCPIYFEMLPQGVNKGNALGKLVELAGLSNHRIIAVGDYTNDLEMLMAADVKVATGNALDAVKAVADIIVCDNNSGAISEVVDWLL